MIEINNKTRSNISLRLVRVITENFLKFNKKRKHDISIAFVGDTAIQRLNKTHRNKNTVTDVLSFPAHAPLLESWVGGTGDGEDNFLGEIIIDYSQIKRQAKKYGNSVKQELIYILVHGLFHLLGYDDKTEKGRIEMEKLGDNFIKKIKI